MSVFVHVGQCGNQLGDAFWRLTADARAQDTSTNVVSTIKKKKNGIQSRLSSQNRPLPTLYSDQFFHRLTRRARCIVVDTEPKVIRSIVHARANELWCFEPAHVHFEQSGRGNNWAMGYNFQTHHRNVIPAKKPNGAAMASISSLATDRKTKRKLLSAGSASTGDGDKRELVDLVMDSLRQEIEAVDIYRGSVLMHSLGGGTGAGLGCRLLETIRDTYPRSYLAAVSVAPSCSSGDTPLQNYNALFTLQHLQEHTDCIIFKENDELMKTALYWKGLLATVNGISPREASKKATLNEMNALTAADVAGLVFPTVRSRGAGETVASPFDMSALVRDCCPMPTAKFLDVRTGVLRQSGLQPKTTPGASTTADPLFHAVPQGQVGVDEDCSLIHKLSRFTVQSYPRFTSATRAISGCAVLRWRSTGSETSTSLNKQHEEAISSGFPHFHLGNHVELSSSCYAPFQAYGGRASLTVALNHGHAVASINQFLDRGRKQFHANAYTHWYKQYGLEDADFEHAFEQSAQIVCQYEDLLNS